MATRQVGTKPEKRGTTDPERGPKAIYQDVMVDGVEGGREFKKSQEGSVATINSVKEIRENFGDG